MIDDIDDPWCGSRRLLPSVGTKMSSSLPSEIFGLILDHLSHERTTLEACCLVSKSWVPWTRRHLFTHIHLRSRKSVESWMEIFPDPSNSPAHHARSLRICSTATTPMTGSNARAWLRSFHLVVTLSVDGRRTLGGYSEVIDLI
jgi:hypothetical protein